MGSSGTISCSKVANIFHAYEGEERGVKKLDELVVILEKQKQVL